MNGRFYRCRPWSRRVSYRRTLAAGAVMLALLVAAELWSYWRGGNFGGWLCWPAILVGAAILTRNGDRRAWARGLGLHPVRADFDRNFPGWLLALLGGSFLLTLGFEALLQGLQIPYEPEQVIQQQLLAATPLQFWSLAVMACLTAPVLEELLFRRILFALLRPLGAIPALGLASLAFGAVHCFLVGLPGLVWMGLIFQLYYLRTRNLAAPMLLHGANNFLNLLLILILKGAGF